jgi:hypothetical protein
MSEPQMLLLDRSQCKKVKEILFIFQIYILAVRMMFGSFSI